MDVAEFRRRLPEFGDAGKYPAGVIDECSEHAEGLTSERRFGSLYGRAVRLATAHFLVLASRALEAGRAGATPGVGGIVSSKTVGSVSVSYDTNGTNIEGAGNWNETSYGRLYQDLASRAGAGGYIL
jgi:hypothetical protein